MTYKEAIIALREVPWNQGDSECIRISNAVNLAIEALEKQIPIERHHTRVRKIEQEIRESICPSCLMVIPTYKNVFPRFCPYCGQALDWTD